MTGEVNKKYFESDSPTFITKMYFLRFTVVRKYSIVTQKVWTFLCLGVNNFASQGWISVLFKSRNKN